MKLIPLAPSSSIIQHNDSSNCIHVVSVANSIETIEYLSLGLPISSGGAGIVFHDTADPSFLFKQFFYASTEEDIEKVIIPECFYFKKYYGDDSACLVKCNDVLYMKMLKVPGKPLSELRREEIPVNSEELLKDMLNRLVSVGIYHIDLHANNILYCPSVGVYSPIDFTTLENKYPYLSEEERFKISLSLLSFSDLYRELFDA